VSDSPVLQADQNLLLLRVKTADVTRQTGRSGSGPHWDPDRPAEPHDGWAVSISWLHLWPVPDYSWRPLYSLHSSALHAPLTPYSQRELLELSHHSTKGKQHAWSSREGEFFLYHVFCPFHLFSYLRRSDDKRQNSISLARYTSAYITTITPTFSLLC